MPYQIKIFRNGVEQDMSSLGPTEFPVLTQAFERFDESLPETYDITVGRIGSTRPPFDRNRMREIIHESQGQQLLVLAHFCYEDEFNAFVQQKEILAADTLIANPDYELIKDHPTATEVYIYPGGYFAIKTAEPGDQPGTSRGEYLFQPPADVKLVRADNLDEIEDTVYMCYMADALP